MRSTVTALRALLAAVLAGCLGAAVPARVADVEYLMVPSAAMGRDIPKA